MLRYLFHVSRKLLTLATLSAIISGIAGASMAKVIGDGVLAPERLISTAFVFFGLCLAYLVTKSCSEIALMHLVQTAIQRMRIDLSRKIIATPLKKLQALGKAELFAILTNDISAFVEAFQTLPLAFGNGVIIATCFVYMAWLSWQMFALFATIIVVCIVGYHLAERHPLQLLVALREKLDVLYEHFRNLIEGSKELQLNAKRGEIFVEEVVAPDARDFRRLFIGAMTRYTLLSNTGLVLFYVIIGILLFVVPLWLPQPAVVLTTFTFILLFLVRPISDMVQALPVLRQAAISLGKIQQLEQELVPPVEGIPARDPFVSADALRLQLVQVCHHYPGLTEDVPFMLGPLDLTVNQGEILFIVGANGSGKTTLALMLLGFYEPEAGTMLLNGVPVTSANLGSYRQYFSAVFADFHLFEQLLVTDREELGARAAHYVEKLDMAHKVTVANGKFSTIKLSSGQRKRLALVSSYLEDRPVYLFDEWAADQDPAFKRVFYTELLPDLKARGKTVIVITHDDAYFGHADRVVKLVEGHLQPAHTAGAPPHAAVAESLEEIA